MLLSSLGPRQISTGDLANFSKNAVTVNMQNGPTPTPTTDWPYPPPDETQTIEPTIEPSRISTETPTPPTSATPSSTPTTDIPATPKGIFLSIDAHHYKPGEAVLVNWRIENVSGNTPGANWKVRFQLPSGWTPVDPGLGNFDGAANQLEISVTTLHGKVSFATTQEAGDVEIQAILLDGETILNNTSLFVYARYSANIGKDGGEVDGKIGKLRVKLKFPKDALTENTEISMQTPEYSIGALPYKGKYPMELEAHNLKDGTSIHKFSGLIEIHITYDPNDIDIHPSTLYLYWYDHEVGTWLPVPREINEKNNLLIAYTDHFSPYAIGENSWDSHKVPSLDAAQTSLFSGSASYSIPVVGPAGPGGIKPSVSLDYNSMSIEGFYFKTPQDPNNAYNGLTDGSQVSWVGAGWSLNAGGSIIRNLGSDINSDIDDTYSLTIGGTAMNLVPVSKGTGFIDYKSTDDNFWKIRRILSRTDSNTLGVKSEERDVWVVWDKIGNRYTFDQRVNYIEVREESLPNCAQGYLLNTGYAHCWKRPWGWFLTQIRNSSNQTLTFTYLPEGSNKCYVTIGVNCVELAYTDQAIYPQEILYPDNHTKIYFALESGNRPDFNYFWGDDTLLKYRYEKRRLSSIRVKIDETVIHEYKLTYFTSSENAILPLPGSRWTPIDHGTSGSKNYEYASGLKSVLECGVGGCPADTSQAQIDTCLANKTCLRPILFTYGNRMFLTEVDNQQGGKVTFAYEAINRDNETPWTATEGDAEQNKELYQSPSIILNPGEEQYINPPDANGQISWGVLGPLPVRPGMGYKLSCWVERTDSSKLTKVRFGIDYLTSNPGDEYHSKAKEVTASTITEYVVIPGNADRVTPTIMVETGGSSVKVNHCYGMPVLTHNRVEKRIISDSAANGDVNNPFAYTYTYQYEGPLANDPSHSTNASYAVDNRTFASQPYTEFRGHHKVTVIEPSGLKTETLFNQDDILQGRPYDIRQYNNTLLLSWEQITWAISRIYPIVENGQNIEFCARKSNTKPCYLDQKVYWVYSTMDETREYGEGASSTSETNFIGIKKEYDHTSQTNLDDQHGTQYGNPTSLIEYYYNGTGWVKYRATRTKYLPNSVEGGIIPDNMKYLVGLPGSAAIYACPSGICDYGLDDLVAYSCNLYDDPVNGGNGLCNIHGSGELLDPINTNQSSHPNMFMQTGKRTLLNFKDDAGNTNYETPHFLDELYFYDEYGNSKQSVSYPKQANLDERADSEYFNYFNWAKRENIKTYDNVFHARVVSDTNVLDNTTSFTTYNDYGADKTTKPNGYWLGLPTWVKDPNEAYTFVDYDAFGRILSLILPGDNSTTPTKSARYEYGTATSPALIEITTKNAYGLSASTRKFYDGLGRLIQTQTPSAKVQVVTQSNPFVTQVTNQDIVIQMEYDAYGKVVRQSVPLTRNVWSSDAAFPIYHPLAYVDIPQNYTKTEYDILGRVSRVTAPDGSNTSYEYTYAMDGPTDYGPTLLTTVKDPKLNETKMYKDVFGRSNQVKPASGPSVLYKYYVTNQLESASYGNSTTTTHYDLAGRKSDMSDPDMGTWYYTYDALGNLIGQADGRGCQTNLAYDRLNRLTNKSFSSNCPAPRDPITYSYDNFEADNSSNPQNIIATKADIKNKGKGQRTGMTDYSGDTTWEYDLRGRLIHEEKNVQDKAAGNNLGTYDTYWSYNPDGTLKQIVYPNQETVNYSYNSQGSIEQVFSILDQQMDKTQLYMKSAIYDETGRMASRTLGNSLLQTDYGYYSWQDPNGLKRLHTLKTINLSNQSTSLQELIYEYDANGNILSIDDKPNGALLQHQAFTYDALNRLFSATVTGQGSYSEEYHYSDQTGNLSSITDKLASTNNRTFDYNSSSPHAATGFNGGDQKYWYGPENGQNNNNGNMTRRKVKDANGVETDYSLSYNADNQLAQINITNGAIIARYIYDGDGKRVLTVVNGVRTVFIGNYFEAEIGSNVTGSMTPPNSGPNDQFNFPICHDVSRCVNGRRIFLPIINSDGGETSQITGMVSGNFGNTYYHTHQKNPPQTGITWRLNYYDGDQMIALRKGYVNGDLFILLTDHLNSSSVTVSELGDVASIRYKAWGGTNYTSGNFPTSRKYTGQIEAEVGLYFFNSRFYDPYITQFTQPDGIIPDPYNPLDWNRYSYVHYNPILYTDPSGHSVDCAIGEHGCRAGKWDEPAPSDIPLTPNGLIVYNLYLNYNAESGWWNHFRPYSMTPDDFLGLAILWERGGAYDLGIHGEWLLEGASRQLWMLGDEVHAPYCTLGKKCVNGIFNFLGGYGGRYHNTERFTVRGDPSEQAVIAIYPDLGENLDSIADTATVWGNKLMDPRYSWVQFNEEGIFDWGNIDVNQTEKLDIAFNLPLGRGKDQLFWRITTNFVMRTYTQFIHPSW